MTGLYRAKKTALYFVFADLLVLGTYAAAQHQSMDCTRSATGHVQLAEGDQNSRSHLQLSRKVEAGATIDLDICAADVTIKAGKDDLLQVSVDFDTPSKTVVGDYLDALDITPQVVQIKLYLPKVPRAKVFIVIPVTTPNLSVNLVHGELSLEANRTTGERKINVVSGNVDILANADSYATLHASVVLGSFHDHRPPHDDAHGMVSKSLSGTGRGSIDVNVVRGNVDLKAWD